MYNRNKTERAVVIVILVAVLFLMCIIRLFNLQIINGEEYRKISEDKLYVAMSVKAPRGEILDRYGSVLVGNRTGFSVQVKDIGMQRPEFSKMIKELIVLLNKEEVSVTDTFPITEEEPFAFTFKATDEKTAEQLAEDWKRITVFQKKQLPRK